MMTTLEALAVSRLRQWFYDRAALRSAHAIDFAKEYIGAGRTQRRAAVYDARIVRVIDIERVLDRLDDESKLALFAVYGEGQDRVAAAQRIGRCARSVFSVLPRARQRLADALDRLDLL